MGRWRDRLDVIVVAATLLIVTVAFGAYLEHRQAVGDARAEKQRSAICSILAALPPSPPPSLQAARAVFARPGHPRDCQPVTRPRVAGTPRAAPTPGAAPQIFFVSPAASPARRATPQPRKSTSPSSPSPRSTRSPTPSPSPTCLLIACLPPH